MINIHICEENTLEKAFQLNATLSYFGSLRTFLRSFYMIRLALVVFSVGSHHFCTRFTSCISHTSEEKEETPTGSVYHQDCEEKEKIPSGQQNLCPCEEKEAQAGFFDRRCFGASLASSFSSRLVKSWNVCSRSTLVRSWLHLAEAGVCLPELWSPYVASKMEKWLVYCGIYSWFLIRLKLRNA